MKNRMWDKVIQRLKCKQCKYSVYKYKPPHYWLVTRARELNYGWPLWKRTGKCSLMKETKCGRIADERKRRS